MALQLRRWTPLAMLPLALGWVWLLGTMGAFEVRFTLFNIPIAVILGIGVDNGVY